MLLFTTVAVFLASSSLVELLPTLLSLCITLRSITVPEEAQ